MKKILITLVVAFVALMGTASASYGADFVDDAGNILPTTITQQVGTPVEYNVMLEDFSGETVYYTIGFNSSGLDIEILEQGTVVTSDDFVVYDLVRATILPGAEQGDEFSARIDVWMDDPTANPEAVKAGEIDFWASASQKFNAQIPEFPTIALPVAAIIGLAFFMQRRKEE
jgi:hypothetical protein